MITQEQLKELLHYDPDTGIFIWKNRSPKEFKTEPSCRTWHSRFLGKEAGTVVSVGYRYIRINGKRYAASRLAWMYAYGCTPEIIDHINGQRCDNRLENLRNTTQKSNCRNQSVRKSNKTGIIGVFWTPRSLKWRAQIRNDYTQIHIGMYEDFFEACCARKSAEAKLGFHPNHGTRRTQESSNRRIDRAHQ
jgi:hypothetical protein